MQRNRKKKALVVAALTCTLSGFGLGLLDVQQEAEAALLPNNPNTVEIVPDLAVYSPEAATPEQPAEPEPVKLYTEADVEMLARLIYTEARGVRSKTEQAAVVWVVLNRLDNPNRLQKTIAEVVCAPHQFDYRPWAPVLPEFEELAADVLKRWQAERDGQADVGRVCRQNTSILRAGAAATGLVQSGSRRSIGAGGWPALMRIEL